MINESTIADFHKALHRACGLPQLAPSTGDKSTWWAFLREMAPLDDPHAGGPLTVQDITDVVTEMDRQRRNGTAAWSLRPSKILRDPELFRDLVLQARKRRTARPRPSATRIVDQIAPTGHRRQVEVPNQAEPATTAELLAALHGHPTP